MPANYHGAIDVTMTTTENPSTEPLPMIAVRFTASACLALALAACGSAVQNDPTYWTPIDTTGATGGSDQGAGGDNTGGGNTGGGNTGGGNTGGSAGSGGGNTGGGGGTTTGGCSLEFAVTTVTAYGDYSPRNVGAIWVSDGGDKFVKTLAYWGNTRLKYLLAWKAASSMNRVDAVSSATLSHHGPHNVSWNCTDVNEQVVGDGSYKVHVEFTEQDSNTFGFPPAGPNTSVPFDKGSAPVDVTPPDASNFVSMHLTFSP
jgi:hypothetical protein